MKILAIHIRRYRSIKATSLKDCGGLNVLIGKNNAGKSNVLSAIDVALRHLRRGRLAAPWSTRRRPTEEFCDRLTDERMQIGIEFSLPPEPNAALRTEVKREAPKFEKAVEQLSTQDRLSFIISGLADTAGFFLFVESIGTGPIDDTQPHLKLGAMSLLNVVSSAARELFAIEREAIDLRSDVGALESLQNEPGQLEYAFRDNRDPERLRLVMSHLDDTMSPALFTALVPIFRAAGNTQEFLQGTAQLIAEKRRQIGTTESRETTSPISAFAGEVRVPPAYATWAMKTWGQLPVLHFRENKNPIGQEEAAALLALKVRRGGEERLRMVRQTVRGLLGVTIDAFEPEETGDRRPRHQRGRSVEMDINDFVVEANGAGIREALRLILDIELKDPALVLIEEPEIHLHPGLEHVLHGYLREKGRGVQMFLTTHSTNFVDTASLQNIYMLSRDADNKTTSEALVLDSAVDRIPSELGLRLSSVFMFDRLLFVEGKSDEDVLRDLARRLELDLATSNVGFVQMGGVRNFAHFAAEGTLEVLSRRKVKMWFLADRDERDDFEVLAMIERLGDNAALHVLTRRELDNYLVFPDAVATLIADKMRVSGSKAERPTGEAVRVLLAAKTQELKDLVVRLRFDRQVLTPVYLQGRKVEGSARERIETALATLNERLGTLDAQRVQVTKTVDDEWASRAQDLVPGSVLLDNTLGQFGFRYSKIADGPKLARFINKGDISSEITSLLRTVCGAEY